MKVISEFIVRLFDLLEAEGRVLRWAVRTEVRHMRGAAADCGLAIVLLLVSGALLVGGVGSAAWGLMCWLETLVGRPLAAVLTGVALGGVGALSLLSARTVLQGRQP